MIDTDQGEIRTNYRPPTVIRRDTNTIVIPLAQDEVLGLIADLAQEAAGGTTYLVIEQNEITHPRTA